MKKCLTGGGKYTPILKSTLPLLLLSMLSGANVYAANDSNLKDVSITISQQQKKITGVVTDKEGVPVIGANVLEKGTTNGTVTDADGRFSLDISRNATLQISYLGYNTQNIVVGNQTTFAVKLSEDSEALDEVVVVAYGTQKARAVTGSMSKLNNEELEDIPVPNISQKMQGKFSGVQITQANGEPGGGMAIRIRGAASVNGGNSPLVVIDGFPITPNEGTGLESISPEEIENITILKDAASTSLYGSRAANGVILVTTKRAKEGKTDVEFSAYFGATQVSKRGRPDVMNAQEFAQFKKEYYEDQAKYEGYTGGVPECYQNPSSLQNGTDWYDVLLQTALTQNYNLSLQSGTTKVKSAVNLNYNKQDGVIINTYSERFSARANNVYEASDRVTFGLNLSGSYMSGQIIPGLGGGRNIIGSAFLMDPQLKYKNDDGTYPISYSQPGMFANPNFYLVLNERDDPKKRMRGTLNTYADVKIIDGLKYRISANADLGSDQTESWVPSIANGAMFTAPPQPAVGSYGTSKYVNWLIENMLTYNKTFADKHNVDLLLGYSTQKTTSENAKINASDYPDDEVGWFNAATTKVGEGDRSSWAMISYLARANYDYMGKYLLSVSFRRDGCSRFGMNAKWANFPSVSAGWIASDESFMERFDRLSYLKLRGSYGIVGNYNIGNYNHLATIGTYNYVFNNGISAGRGTSGIGNADLTWETTKQLDFGVDLGLFNDRVFLVYDYYWKKTDGLLYQIDIPYSSGFENIQSNIGEFRFWGHEVGLETKNMTGKFKWNTSLNLTFNRNKAMKLGTNNTPIGGNNNQEDYNRTEVGKPLGLFYGYVYDGVFMTQEEYEAGPKHASSMVGTVRMKDLNGDNVIDNNDRTFIGDPNPDCIFGMTNTFSWKDFDASVVFTGSLGGDIIDGTYEWTENIDGVFNVRKEVAERWRSEDNPGNGNIPRTRTGTTELFRYTNSRWVFKNNYITLKNITLGYTIPMKSNPYIKGIRVYGSAQNLFTVGSYPGMNPEVNKNTSGLYQGVDHTTYPVARIYTIGLNVKF
ncbi:SusC/RagA family TonB-linked outer membrane protein [Parabacteroides goldsteinii]|uniref:SusC/RagA family TonB-linked outer membrane protein n=2 Tax=Tannerellaceae TaxID=2005525 RepID=UPI002165B22C|nr:TonB-dependent receptor [Parabacteroides goldsteinii]MCS2428412.1 TonB-dependent receptor [Parabacteroides goldsteinii]